MYARVHTLETSPDRDDQGLEVVRDHLLPWMRDSTGFCGLIRLVERGAGGQVLVVTLWRDEDALARSAEAAERLGVLGATASGASRRSLREYDVSVFDVDV